MNKKIVGILICTLLIAVAVIPATSLMTISNKKPVESSLSSDIELEQKAKSSQKNEPIENDPLPEGTKTGHLSIPAAAFTPRDNDMYVKNIGHELTGDGFFVAPVYLPQGVTVTNLSYYWRNEMSASARSHLSRNYMDGTADELANVWIDGGVYGNGFTWTENIDFAEIDNSKYSYFIELGIGLCEDERMYVYGFIIEYTYETGGSSEEMAGSEESQGFNVAVS